MSSSTRSSWKNPSLSHRPNGGQFGDDEAGNSPFRHRTSPKGKIDNRVNGRATNKTKSSIVGFVSVA
ncbi:MAG TPA: hypothetical protein DCE39_12035 [Planctomycetaceae bacterium]|nr:hypothetical protein [Planctomycetaceae bacterium]